MSGVPSKLEAVRQAKEKLGQATSQEIAAFIQVNFGISLQPAIVTVLLGSLREREHLEQSKRRVLELAEKAKAG